MRQAVLLFPHGSHGESLVRRRVAGLNLLDRQIRTLARAGMEHISVLLPKGAAPTLTPITQKLPVRVEFLTHGAAPALSDPEAPYLLLLGEYVHHHSSLSGWLSHLDTAPSLVALSTAHPQQKGILHRANPEFSETEDRTETVSSGAFCCHPSAVPPASLGEGEQPWRLLAERNGEDVHFDVSERVLWRRVDQPGGVRQVKNMLFSQVTKTTSGFVSRHINARLSIPTSKLLVETGLSPHAITVLLVLTTGLYSAYLVSIARDYSTLLIGGILWQLAAVFDRCDGEVARVKLCESKFGAWFDTVTDNFAYLCGYLGTLVGMIRIHEGQSLYAYVGISSIAAMFVTLFVMYSYARRTGSGSLQHYLRALTQEVDETEKSWVQKLMERYGFVAKRDFFSFYVFLACAANQLALVYWFLVTVLHLTAAAVLLSQPTMMRSYRKSLQNCPSPPTGDAEKS